jgi:hypothetical protein
VCQSSKGRHHQQPFHNSLPARNNQHNSEKILNTIYIGKQLAAVRVLTNGQPSITPSSRNTYITVELAGISIILLIDTGAQVSVLTKSALNRLPPRYSFLPASNMLKNFGGSPIHVIGTITVFVRYREEHVPNATFHVVQRKTSILWQDLFDALHFHIIDDN